MKNPTGINKSSPIKPPLSDINNALNFIFHAAVTNFLIPILISFAGYQCSGSINHRQYSYGYVSYVGLYLFSLCILL